jgi:lipopolysaccharide export system permease protein
MKLRLSSTLSFYIGRHFILWLGVVFAGFVGIILLITIMELMTRASGKPAATFVVVLNMALLKMPFLAQEAIPFAMLFGGMLAFWKLNRSNELVAVRASGVSVWQFTLPALVIALLIGFMKIGVMNPAASLMLTRYEQMEHKYLTGRSSLLAVSRSGVWLRQADENGQSVIHAQQAVSAKMELKQVLILIYEGADHFVRRIDAATARLDNGYWELSDAHVTEPGSDPLPRFHATYRLRTDLTPTKILQSFASPETISFWDLPRFIQDLESAGFSALAHRLHWNSLLAEPLLLCAMILIAGAFSLRHNRRSGVFIAVIGGVATGFVVYFASHLVLAVASKGAIPATLAAWAPAGATTLLGLSTLLHLEDG